jgi:hypothetical protein
VGAANVIYAADLASANVSVRALHRTNASVVAYFNGKATGSMWQRFTAATASGPVSVSLNASDGSTITLEPIDFVWNVPAVKARVCRSCAQGGVVFVKRNQMILEQALSPEPTACLIFLRQHFFHF